MKSRNYGKYVFRRIRNGRKEYFARVGYYDENGQWKYKYEKAESEDDAKSKAKKIIESHQKRGTAIIDGSRMTFEQFADWYQNKYLIAPVYEQGQQIEGLRTFQKLISQLNNLRKFFDKKKISQITDEILHQFKNKRKNLDGVKTATVNRDLELLRAMFAKAVKQGWLEESPFQRAENLIRKSLESRRRVTVSQREENLIFDVSKASDNKYLYPLVLALRDTGARPSELFPYAAYGVDLDRLAQNIKSWLDAEVKSDNQVFLPLCWFQLFKVEFQAVPLISLKSRQVEYRFGTMTARLRAALVELWETTNKNPVALVFPFKSIKKEWQKIRDNVSLVILLERIGKDAELQKKYFGENSIRISEILQESGGDFSLAAKSVIELKLKPKILDVEIRDLRIRDWRRIYATTAQTAGVAENITQRILGHKLQQTTYHYTEADLQAVIEASKKLDEVRLASDLAN